jgi:hypothetical protein
LPAAMITMSSAMLILNPKTSIIRSARLGLLALGALLLAGCVSMRIAYNHAPDLVYWKLDSYADFDSEQKTKVKQAIVQWMHWHRTTQLPDYVALMASHRHELQGNVTPAAVCSLFERGRERVDRGWTQVLPSVAEIALTLKPAQLDHIEKKYAKVNEETRKDYLQESPDERHRAVVKRAINSAEKLYGDLGPAQREVIDAGVADSPQDADLWFAERQARQQEILATTRRLIAEHATRAQALTAYKQLVADMRRSPNAAYAAQEEKVQQYNCGFWAAIHNSTTPQQRRHASERLERWATDFQLLIDEQ